MKYGRKFTNLLAIGLLLLSSAFITITATTGATYAEEGSGDSNSPVLQISPTMKRFDLKPGGTQSGEMTVRNTGKVDFTFKVYAAPYSIVGDNYEPNFSSENNYTQISRWITFEGSEKEYTLKPDQAEVIKYDIEVPKDVPAGGQYATIFAETVNKDSSATSGLQAVSRVGMVIYASVEGDTRTTAELQKFDLPTFYSAFNVPDVTLTGRVKNTGNTDFEVKYRIKVQPLIGEVAYEDEKVQVVLPDTEREAQLVWPDTPLLGIFNVTVSVTAADIHQEFTSTVLVLPPWLIVIVLLLLTLLVVWIIIRLKRREQLKSKFKI